jgi:predicted RND superfamily exporter protein
VGPKSEVATAFREDQIAVTGAPVGEALLGIHILEDLGVPKRLLGFSTRAHAGEAKLTSLASLHELRVYIGQHIGLVPVTAVVMMVIFFLSFRNFLATLLPLPGMLATLLVVFGMMGWLGVPIYLTLAVMPVLLIATGVTNDVYLFSRYFTLLRQKNGVNHLELLQETFDGLVCPVVNTSLTAAVGFLSFGFSPLAPVRAFGLCTGLGVLLGLVFSCSLVPALLALINPAWLRPRHGSAPAAAPSALAAWFGAFGRAVVRWRWAVVGFIVFMVLLTPLGLRRLLVQDSWTDAFDPSSEFRQTTHLVNEQFHGMHLLLLSVDLPRVLKGELSATAMTKDGIVLRREFVAHPALIAGSAITISAVDKPPAAGSADPPPRAVFQSHIEMAYGLGNNITARVPTRDVPTNFWQEFKQTDRAKFEVVVHTQVLPEVVRAVRELGTFIRERRQYAVGGVITPTDYLSTTRFMTRPNDPDARALPDDPGEIKLMWDYYGLARGQQRLHQIVDTNFWQSLTTIFLKDANFVDTAKLMTELHKYEHEHLASQGIKLGFAGDVAVSQSLIQGIVTTQLQSLFWSLLGICLVTVVLGGSWRWGILCVLPSALAVLIKLAVMGWLGIPLGVATSMFAAMTLGIGVNCAIQLLEAFGQARSNEISLPEALSQAMALTGPPALVNTIAVSLGFGALMLSQVPANARLGLLVVLGLVECFIVSLLLLPPLLYWWPLRQPRHAD